MNAPAKLKTIDDAATIKCVGCGRFISYVDIDAGHAKFHFEPDSHFGPEVSEWECPRCITEQKQ